MSHRLFILERKRLEQSLREFRRSASAVLLAPAGLAREGMLMHFRLATIPFLGEMILQPTAERLQLFWRLAFSDPSFVS